MKTNILVTAIGSFSADCVIKSLKEDGNNVYGCDIYPSEWHAISKECKEVYRVPLASQEKEYITYLLDICLKQNIKYIIPLTDIEIDVLNRNRTPFNKNKIILCISSPETLAIVRNKYNLYKKFQNDTKVPTIATYNTNIDDIPDLIPSIAKPYNGRSSEGLIKIDNEALLKHVKTLKDYIVQEYKDGPIFTVDYVRNSINNNDFAIPREELLRTKNGAGLTVKISNEYKLNQLVSYIGHSLNINGAVNMEFIKNKQDFYLIDINPRFSAGVAFSRLVGYDIIKSHLNCFTGKDILPKVQIQEQIIAKKYIEIITKKYDLQDSQKF